MNNPNNMGNILWNERRLRALAARVSNNGRVSAARLPRGDLRAVLPIQEGLVDTSNAQFLMRRPATPPIGAAAPPMNDVTLVELNLRLQARLNAVKEENLSLVHELMAQTGDRGAEERAAALEEAAAPGSREQAEDTKNTEEAGGEEDVAETAAELDAEPDSESWAEEVHVAAVADRPISTARLLASFHVGINEGDSVEEEASDGGFLSGFLGTVTKVRRGMGQTFTTLSTLKASTQARMSKRFIPKAGVVIENMQAAGYSEDDIDKGK